MPAPALFGGVVRANLLATGDQYWPSVAGLSNGRIAIGYSTTNAVQWNFFRASGIQADAYVTGSGLSTAAAVNENWIDIVALSDGRVVAIAMINGDFRFRYTSDTEGQSDIVEIIRDGIQSEPVLAAGINGRFVILGRDDSNSGDVALFRVVSGVGGYDSIYRELTNGTAIVGNQTSAEAASLTDGRYITAWHDANDNTIKGEFLTATGVRGTIFTIMTGFTPLVTGRDGRIGLDGLAGGGFIVSASNSGTGTISYRLFDAAGTPTTGILQTSNFGANLSQVAVGLPDGRIMLVTAATNGGSYDIMGQMLNADGTLDGIPFAIANTPNAEAVPTAALLADGRVVVGFVANGLVGGDGTDIAYQIVDPRNGPVVVVGQPLNDEFYGTEYGDSLIGGAGNDLLDGRGGDDGLYGGDDTDELYGLGGNDYLSDGNGNDYVSAGDGDDLLYSANGLGSDTLIGGAGTDSFYVDTADIVIEAAGGGNADRIYAFSSYTLAAGAAVEFLTTAANAGTDAINLTGNELAQSIYGNNGANSIWGREGNDTILPLGGLDNIYFDTAPGASNVDDIVGFSSTDDLIFLDDAVFTGILGGFLAADAFASGAGLTTAGAGIRIFHNSTTGDLYWDSDGTGAAAAVRFANIGAGTPIFNYDFFIN